MTSPIHDDQDGFLTELGRSHLADADLQPEAEDRLRRELEHRFERQRVRRRRMNTGIVASLVLVISVLAIQTDVISDVLDLVFRNKWIDGKPSFRSESTDRNYMSAADSASTLEEHRAFVEKTHQAWLAGEWKLYSVNGYTLGGFTEFITTWEVEVDGEFHKQHDMWPLDNQGPEFREWRRIWEAVYYGPLEDMRKQMVAGTARELPQETVVHEGVAYEFEKYSATFPDWGEIIVWVYMPPD